MEELERRGTSADQLLDELLPEELDWQRLVRAYPIAALSVAAVGGFLLGRNRGRAIVVALSAFAADSLTENVNTFIGKQVL
ncbi:MAG: hypothetical protein EP299_13135 [Acidobacteria bacterium]|nr:MAG: hypothetical protein EP299_13135 [Acidobacteriota bacterium]